MADGAMFLGCAAICVVLPLGALYLWIVVAFYRRKRFSLGSWTVAILLPVLAVSSVGIFGDRLISDLDAPSPLMTAACDGDLDGVKARIGQGDSVDESDGFGETPLGCAIAADHLSVAEFLLKKGADPDAKCGDGFEFEGVSPREWAEQSQNPAFKRLLAKYPKRPRKR